MLRALLNRHRLYALLRWLPLLLAAATLGLLAVGHFCWPVGAMLVAWGALNAAVPVAWPPWLAQNIGDEPDSGGGLLVGADQLAIMLGATLGGALLDHISSLATFLGGVALLVTASFVVSSGTRLQPADAQQ